MTRINWAKRNPSAEVILFCRLLRCYIRHKVESLTKELSKSILNVAFLDNQKRKLQKVRIKVCVSVLDLLIQTNYLGS